MDNAKKRRPDYSEMYPGVSISEEVLAFLKQSDRKMEYQQHDIKRSRYARGKDGKRLRDANGQLIILPEREVSLDKLISEDWGYPSSEPLPEDVTLANMDIDELYRCLDLLNDDERALIDELFFSNGGDGMSERDYSSISGIPQKTINDRKRRILAKLKNFFES